jgi:hypothetical protein
MKKEKPSPKAQAQATHATPFTNGGRLTCELIETVSRGFQKDSLPDVQKRIDNLNFDEQRQVRRVIHVLSSMLDKSAFEWDVLIGGHSDGLNIPAHHNGETVFRAAERPTTAKRSALATCPLRFAGTKA